MALSLEREGQARSFCDTKSGLGLNSKGGGESLKYFKQGTIWSELCFEKSTWQHGGLIQRGKETSEEAIVVKCPGWTCD